MVRIRVLAAVSAVVLATLAVRWATAQVKSTGLIPDPDQSALPAVLEGARNAAASVRTGHGNVTVLGMLNDDQGITTTETETAYNVWFSGTRFRISAQAKYLINDVPPLANKVPVSPQEVIAKEVAYDGQAIVVYRPSEKSAVISDSGLATGRRELNEYRVSAQIPGIGVLDPTSFRPAPPGYSVQDPKLVGHEDVNGDACAVVDIVQRPASSSLPTRTWRFWIDMDKAFAIPRLQLWEEGGDLRSRTLVSETTAELRQYGSVWGPSKATITEYRPDPNASGSTHVDSEWIITFGSDFGLNVSVSDGDLALTLPPGTTVTDEVMDAEYSVP
jgi:hypothetical protein